MSEGAPISGELIEALLPRELDPVSIARRLVDERLHRLIDEQPLDDLKAVVGELVSDAYIHGEGAIRLRVQALGERLRVVVIDEGEKAANKMREQGGELGPIVETLALEWGADERTHRLWAELPIRH
ncbi:MAG: ATP-binding protein [Solirubrobacteraceae bacterium]